VNRPSVDALRPDHGRGNSHHTQSCRKGKKGSVGNGGRENTCDRDHGREPGRNSGNTGSSEQRRRVTFVLDFRSAGSRKLNLKHRGLARGWLVVNPFGVTEPMVGWKRAPLSTVVSRLVFPISVYVLYFELNILDACSCLCTHKWSLYRSDCLVF
jgi:hypothetical protein